MRVNLGWKAAAALLTLALAACGDDPDETVPALTLESHTSSIIYVNAGSVGLNGTLEPGAELSVVAGGDATAVILEVTGDTWKAEVSNPPTDSDPQEGETILVTITATDDPGNTNMIQLFIVFDAQPPGIEGQIPEAGLPGFPSIPT